MAKPFLNGADVIPALEQVRWRKPRQVTRVEMLTDRADGMLDEGLRNVHASIKRSPDP